MTDYIEDVFGEDGFLAKKFPGYCPRPGQIAFARAVDRAITSGNPVLAEAPTGTGKSIGYSVPAIYHAFHNQKQIVIVTANISLQEQIVNKDLPLLREILPWPFSQALFKGRNNFLCTDAYYERQKNVLVGLDRDHERNGKQLPILEEWAKATIAAGPKIETGDMSELPFEPDRALWSQYSVTGAECKKQRCQFKDRCFPNASYAKAHDANIVVTNYALLFAHLGVYLQAGLDVILPPFDVCILDEGHKAPDIARDFFGFKHTYESVRRLSRKTGSDYQKGALDSAARSFFNALIGLKNDKKRYKARLIGNFFPSEMKTWEHLKGTLQETIQCYADAIRFNQSTPKRGEMETYMERTRKALDHLTLAIEQPSGGRLVHFLEEDDRRSLALTSRLIHPGDALTPGLFEKRSRYRVKKTPDQDIDDEGRTDRVPDEDGIVTGGYVSVVVASATLATDGNDFSFIAEEMGVPDIREEMVAESPFDWKEACLFIVPGTMPEPQTSEYQAGVARHVEKIVALAGGRTLGLFTSRKIMESTYDACVGPFHKLGIKLLKQGDAPRSQLVERFKRETSSVLFGLESFWAGVDVPGESCSVVVIDRLPFPTPDDPIMDVLSEQDDKAFFKHGIPRSIIQFKQGFGRAVRALTDRSVVVCLDQRIITKRYGRQFIRALPPGLPKSTKLEAIVDWLRPREPAVAVNWWD